MTPPDLRQRINETLALIANTTQRLEDAQRTHYAASVDVVRLQKGLDDAQRTMDALYEQLTQAAPAGSAWAERWK